MEAQARPVISGLFMWGVANKCQGYSSHMWLGFCLNLGWRYEKIIIKDIDYFGYCRESWFLYVKMVHRGVPELGVSKNLGENQLQY